MKQDGNLRERIVNAALDIIETQGLKALTQPRLAKATGMRQSHLTYYYPRKADLFAALLEGSHQRAASRSADSEDVIDLLQSLVSDSNRMRFFLGITLELSEEPELRDMLAAHAHELTLAVASYFGRTPKDPSVQAFIDRARGIGIRLLIDPSQQRSVDLRKVARDIGLRRPRNDRSSKKEACP